MLKHCFFSMCKNIDPHCIVRQHVWLSHSQKLRVLEMQLRSLHVVCLQLRSSQSALQQCTLREHPQLLCQSASNGKTTWKLATLVPAAQKLAILDASRLHMWSNHSRELALPEISASLGRRRRSIAHRRKKHCVLLAPRRRFNGTHPHS